MSTASRAHLRLAVGFGVVVAGSHCASDGASLAGPRLVVVGRGVVEVGVGDGQMLRSMLGVGVGDLVGCWIFSGFA